MISNAVLNEDHEGTTKKARQLQSLSSNLLFTNPALVQTGRVQHSWAWSDQSTLVWSGAELLRVHCFLNQNGKTSESLRWQVE